MFFLQRAGPPGSLGIEKTLVQALSMAQVSPIAPPPPASGAEQSPVAVQTWAPVQAAQVAPPLPQLILVPWPMGIQVPVAPPAQQPEQFAVEQPAAPPPPPPT